VAVRVKFLDAREISRRNMERVATAAEEKIRMR
jgi:hypothetical protein